MKRDVKKPENESERTNDTQYSLNDDRRVKVLSPGALVVKRFFRNRLAIVGLIMILSMAVFSFLGGLIIPYGESEQFYIDTNMRKEYVGVTHNDTFRYIVPEGESFSSILQSRFTLAQINGNDTFEYDKAEYTLTEDGKDLYSIRTADGTLVAVAFKDIVNAADGVEDGTFTFKYEALKAYAAGKDSFDAEGKSYALDADGNITLDGKDTAYISRFVVQPKENGITVTKDFREFLAEKLDAGETEFTYEGTDYQAQYDPSQLVWSVLQNTSTHVYDKYSSPSLKHPLGTDSNGMDVLTRLMYGGRVSLVIGFIVVFLETFIGVILGGISGYFGGWVDNLIMRLVDVFYCIPSLPIIIILGSVMDKQMVDPQIRMLYLMLILGFLGWAGTARLVRGQILSLREQEFMTATEACGISVSRRIFRHLIPNVVPQLIVTCTMGLGSTIITEATLSFLGLGVKFPFASWGNIISDVNNSFVMTNYWFVWIPAGICLMIAVLGFNFVGDGLRDAFDPKMKR